jgi:hypothetical protein
MKSRSIRLSALWYTGLSLAAALIFLKAAIRVGEAPLTAVLGGAIWVFSLSMIVSMPLVTGWVKRRYSKADEEGGPA